MTRTRQQREEKASVKTESKPVDPVKEEVESLLDNLDTIPPPETIEGGQALESRDHEELAAQAAADAEIAAAMAAEEESRSLAAEREREALQLDPIEKMRRATGVNIPDPNR